MLRLLLRVLATVVLVIWLLPADLGLGVLQHGYRLAQSQITLLYLSYGEAKVWGNNGTQTGGMH